MTITFVLCLVERYLMIPDYQSNEVQRNAE